MHGAVPGFFHLTCDISLTHSLYVVYLRINIKFGYRHKTCEHWTACAVHICPVSWLAHSGSLSYWFKKNVKTRRRSNKFHRYILYFSIDRRNRQYIPLLLLLLTRKITENRNDKWMSQSLSRWRKRTSNTMNTCRGLQFIATGKWW